MKLYFPEIVFSAAHYIPGHETCGSPHGHTYFVRNLEVEVESLDNKGMSIDFGIIEGYFKEQWDHKNVVPASSLIAWQDFYKFMGYKDNLKPIKYTTAEWMTKEIRQELGAVLGWDEVYAAANIHFELWEGPHQAVKV